MQNATYAQNTTKNTILFLFLFFLEENMLFDLFLISENVIFFKIKTHKNSDKCKTNKIE